MNITSKEQLRRILSTELGKEMGGGKSFLYKLLLYCKTDRFSLIWLLRHAEFYSIRKDLIGKFLFRVFIKRYTRVELLTGVSIPLGCCDEGLTIYHIGSIVLNGRAHIGRNCCIMNNVNIGSNNGEVEAPSIGNNVYIGPGAVIYGNIEIADNCYIGANAVVNKSFKEPGSVIIGVPAKVYKTSELVWWQKNKMERKL